MTDVIKHQGSLIYHVSIYQSGQYTIIYIGLRNSSEYRNVPGLMGCLGKYHSLENPWSLWQPSTKYTGVDQNAGLPHDVLTVYFKIPWHHLLLYE